MYTRSDDKKKDVAGADIPPAGNEHQLEITMDLHDMARTMVVMLALLLTEITSGDHHEGVRLQRHQRKDGLTLRVKREGRPDLLLDLNLARGVVADSYVERHQTEGGGHHVTRPKIEPCHYQGSVKGQPGTWAAVSTCNGISGAVHDGDELLLLEGEHVTTYRPPRASNFSCGVSDGFQEARGWRRRRDAAEVRGVSGADHTSRYIELIMVVDHAGSRQGTARAAERCRDIANVVNAVFAPLNVFVALVGVVTWSHRDEVALSPPQQMLENFLQYRSHTLNKQHHNDNAHLLTQVKLDGGVVGRAKVGGICSEKESGGVTVDHSDEVVPVALTMAHELGHNMGMNHDDNIKCTTNCKKCVMAASHSSEHHTIWSQCSRDAMAATFRSGLDFCLHNLPARLDGGPRCGDGFVEGDEQCDCGPPGFCTSRCCNAATCRLAANASCGSGLCCDVATCQPRAAAWPCRPARSECDVPEFCSGESETCPPDLLRIDGDICGDGRCHAGQCGSHDQHCRQLWGESVSSGPRQCYQRNLEGKWWASCSPGNQNVEHRKCSPDEVMCGRLHCTMSREINELKLKGDFTIYSAEQRMEGDSNVLCRSVGLSREEQDIGMVPDGAPCGADRMCLKQRCQPVSAKNCSSQCHGRGVCNSRGNCHCQPGFEPPFCASAGRGGSLDSGPALPPGSLWTGVGLFLGAMLLMTVVLLAASCLAQPDSPHMVWLRGTFLPASLRTANKTPGRHAEVKQQPPRPAGPHEASKKTIFAPPPPSSAHVKVPTSSVKYSAVSVQSTSGGHGAAKKTSKYSTVPQQEPTRMGVPPPAPPGSAGGQVKVTTKTGKVSTMANKFQQPRV